MAFVLAANSTSTSASHPASTGADATWIASLRRLLNPFSLCPPKSLEVAINHGWRNVLRSYIVDDLQANHTGQRTHLWAEKNCMIVFQLSAIPAAIDLFSFSTMTDLDVQAFASCAAWIFCPQTSGPCAVQTVKPTASHNAEPSKWEQRKPELPLICTKLHPYIHTSPDVCSISSISSLALDSILENDETPSIPLTPNTPLSQISTGSNDKGEELNETSNISNQSVDSKELKVVVGDHRVHFVIDNGPRQSRGHPRPRVPTPVPSLAKGNGIRPRRLATLYAQCTSIEEEELLMKLESLDHLSYISASEEDLHVWSPSKRLIVKRLVIKAAKKLGGVLLWARK